MKIIVLTPELLASGDASKIAEAIKAADAVVVATDVLALNDARVAAETTLAIVQKDLDDSTALNTKQMESIKKLTAKLEKAAAVASVSTAPKKSAMEMTFKVGDDEYGFQIPALTHKGVRITPVDILASTELQETLVKIQSGMIYLKANN